MCRPFRRNIACGARLSRSTRVIQVPSWDDDYAFRIGALTIHTLGRLAPDVPGSHSKEHIYPAGFRSS